MFELLWDVLSDGEKILTLLVGAAIGAAGIGYLWHRHERGRRKAGL